MQDQTNNNRLNFTLTSLTVGDGKSTPNIQGLTVAILGLAVLFNNGGLSLLERNYEELILKIQKMQSK